MEDNLRILFMGTPEFSVPMLDAIHQSHHDLIGVVTAPDKPSGRGRKLSKSAVKQFAEQHNIEVYQPTNLKSDNFLDQLRNLNPNLIVVVAFRMLPKVVWDYPKYGTFNLHASRLPDYRGAAPINWAIINGEEQTGLTTFFIDEKIDTGLIIDQVSIPIEESDNVSDLYNKMLPMGVRLVLDTLDTIKSGSVQTITQVKSDEGLKMAPKLTKENMRINWGQPAIKIYNHVRGLSPFPLAWAVLFNNDKEIICKISKVRYTEDAHNLKLGTLIIEEKSIRVATGKGFIELLEIKLSGKRLMDTKTLLNGYKFAEDSKML